METIFNFLVAKKAWVGSIVALIMQFADIVRQVIADESISFDEAEVVVRAFVALVISIAVLLGVYHTRNEPTTTLPSPPNEPPMQARGGF